MLPKEGGQAWNLQMHGLLVVKDNQELAEALTATVDSLLSDGTMNKIFQKYELDEGLLLDGVIVNEALKETGLD